jgi:imidazolonepropionase-like amidohydrolase
LIAAVIALRGATLVDGTGAAARPNALLVVENGRVVSLATATDEALARVPAGAEIIDVAGKWIIPGLVDAHVHAESEADLKQMIRWGVTSARLMAEDVAVAGAAAAGRRPR